MVRIWTTHRLHLRLPADPAVEQLHQLLVLTDADSGAFLQGGHLSKYYNYYIPVSSATSPGEKHMDHQLVQSVTACKLFFTDWNNSQTKANSRPSDGACSKFESGHNVLAELITLRGCKGTIVSTELNSVQFYVRIILLDMCEQTVSVCSLWRSQHWYQCVHCDAVSIGN